MEAVRQFGRQTFSSLRIRNYRLYFIGQGISQSGTWMQTIGQGLLVLRLTGSGTALGLVTALQTLPILFFAPLGGVIADRFPKRQILYATQTAAGTQALILGLLVATDAIRIWMVYILAIGLGLINTVDNPTRQTFVLEMVGKDSLTNAVSLNSTEINLARVIGPSIAGALVALVGLAACFLVNGVSYFAVVAVLHRMRAGELQPAPRMARAKGQFLEGFRYVRSMPMLRNTLLMMAIIGTFTYEFTVILPLFAEFTFGKGASGYALLTASMGAGAVVGGIVTASRKRQTTTSMLLLAAFLFGLTDLIAALAPTLPFAMAAFVLVGFFSITFTALGNVTVQLASAPEMRGRVMALWTMAFLGSTPIGGPIIGWIGQHAGPRWGLAVGGMAAVLASGYGAWALRRTQKATVPVEGTRAGTL
ncbi:MAG TPA: MFS transporter [Thermomicrobiales bacterium]|jgi:MFS family permease